LEVIGMKPLVKKNPSLFVVLFSYRESKNMIVEIIDQKNKKGKSHSEVDLKYMQPSHIFKIHKATGDTLDDYIDGLEAENSSLKEKIK
jgi:hypothetical protein